MKTKANSARQSTARKKWTTPQMTELTVRNAGAGSSDFLSLGDFSGPA